MRAVRGKANEKGGAGTIGTGLRESMSWLVTNLPRIPIRRIVLGRRRRPVHVFTDGACEPAEGGRFVTTIGAVLIADERARAGGYVVPEEVAQEWRSGESWQVIGQAAIFPVFVAKRLWREFLVERDVFYWIDNNAARQGLIQGYSPVMASCKILGASAAEDVVLKGRPWYARVPAEANIGDPASRLSMHEVRRHLPQVACDEVGPDS